ncbi:hypothetical protein DRP53_01785 [candidate division WOR-3 bacterium]|uniref:Uncharacterized protein n=1 Tax=candidate division WOR-3 bacterium TaxID=2052148 RepID=A0A660SLL0_UNCW3|nr:MAG: hypothetical protein DRP53_01785 [candidate division WOR-3 bacterium]
MLERIAIFFIIVAGILILRPSSSNLSPIPQVAPVPELGCFQSVRSDPFIRSSPTPDTQPEFILSIKGIVMDRSGGMVIIETDKEPLILKPGEQYQGVRIIKITEKFVVTSHRGRKDTTFIW